MKPFVSESRPRLSLCERRRSINILDFYACHSDGGEEREKNDTRVISRKLEPSILFQIDGIFTTAKIPLGSILWGTIQYTLPGGIRLFFTFALSQ